MKNEKVKEIKEKLQEEIFIATKFDDKLRRVETKDLQDILTLINELEKENSKLLDSVETVQSNRCVYKCVLTKEHLTKFAERLKEKFYYVFGNEYEQSVSGFDTKVLIEYIDETLKELKDENN